MPKWWCVLKRKPADSPKYFKDDTSVNISNKRWWFNKGGCVCGNAQTALWAHGIEQQFVHRWLLKQTSNLGDRSFCFFFFSRLDLALLKCAKKPPVRSDRPGKNRRQDRNKPKPQRDKEMQRVESFAFTFQKCTKEKWRKEKKASAN